MKPYIPFQNPCGYAQRLGASETCRYGFPFGFKPQMGQVYACVSKILLGSRWSEIEGWLDGAEK